MEKFAYIRVSSKDQNTARQLDAFYKLGLDDSQIFMDKMSGSSFNRPAYQRLINPIR